MGLPYSLNLGIKSSKSKYFVRLDSDDYVNKNFLLDDNKIDLLTNLIENKYRDRLQPDDLLDPNLADESLEILDALEKIFKTGSIYNFQKI